MNERQTLTYDLVGELLLSFLLSNEQQDVIVDEGFVETDGHTVWYTGKKGRFESITEANIVEVGLDLGVLRARS